MNAHFATTRWSLVRSASAAPEPRREALSELYQLYWRPICDYLRRMGISETEAEDVAQDFFLNFFESRSLDRADEGQGRFRAYLLGALRHHVQKVHRKASAKKRGGGKIALSLEAVDQENATPDADHARLFDLEWAQTVVSHSMTRLEKETQQQGIDADLTTALVNGDATVPQREIAAQLGITVTALKTRVFRMRRRFRELLREEVQRTVANDVELEAELVYISEILGGPSA
ncbi:sigma-70 family RNA polymerase sigma factor [Phragmitibacter flavus]|uniref:Sigma-70 family RNA polymerase sigma factor n=1 Tax=Phragmitibacter flavus TaxID=2576071 RepID=A0A5R8KIZ4_9BACT|nr:sigma-70 family RNA polymerase sigma factor [Phragmitibacter flavus]TLD71589.1 sigma-70 family RNA polymerase sigma factor [Phragmitibacter flavus]